MIKLNIAVPVNMLIYVPKNYKLSILIEIDLSSTRRDTYAFLANVSFVFWFKKVPTTLNSLHLYTSIICWYGDVTQLF